MVLKYTPKSKQQIAPDFNLLDVDGQPWSLQKAMGKNGLVVMFICNHCPYVKSIQTKLVSDVLIMQKLGVHAVAIMSNDPEDNPEDSLEQMKVVSEKYSYPFPYLLDETQQVAKAFGAVCTPDIFGLDRYGVIQYRGRLDAAGMNDHQDLRRDLVEAMKEMVATGTIKTEQFPSMGCSIKWK
ncbi:thioredoxin family protein [Marinicella litoralis]|uniref:Peroxiredoxin n=1 Tax=Marinicella litoralis TaxID=644220 RepID=A0A4R6XR81_9GAMM|nr:thioredoxin family protein [Marinicella litoralis]TDR22382.1 peroxiredoxin [Marinicella litoralis]